MKNYIDNLHGKGLYVFSDPGGAKPCLSFVGLNKISNYLIVSDRKYSFYKDFGLNVKILKEIDEHIFNGQLTDIIEVTYAYKKMPDNHYWNETLFGYFAGFRLDSSNDLEKVSKITENKLNVKIKLVDKYLTKISGLSSMRKAEKIRADILN